MWSSLQLLLTGLYLINSVVQAKPLQPLRRDAQKPKTPVDAATFANLIKYPAYDRAIGYLANGGCKVLPYGSVIEEIFNNSATDTQAAIFRNDQDKEIVLSIPGTNSTRDRITDITFLPVPYLSAGTDCIGCVAHLGFLSAWDSIAKGVEARARDILSKHPDYNIVVTGTSLGAGIGVLAFATLKGSAKLPVKAAYTYGQPRVGNLLFANYVDRLAGATDTEAGIYHRVTHLNDGVPLLPPTLLGTFVHPRTEYWESGNLTFSPETTYRCYGQEPSDCVNAQHGFGQNAAHTTYAGYTYQCNGQ